MCLLSNAFGWIRSSLAFLAFFFATSSHAQVIYGPPPPPPKPSVPKLYCPNPSYNWGTVYSGEQVIHSFDIYNKGTATLIVKRVRPSCGCTTTSYDREIKPGGKGQITLKVNTRGFRNTVRKTARVETNDPENPSLILRIQGEVKPIVTVEPSYPTVEVLKGEVGSTKFTVKSEIPQKVEIVELKSGGTVKVESEVKEIEKGKRYEVLLKVDSKSVRSTYFYGQPISLDMKVRVGEKSYTVPVRARVRVVNTVNPSRQYIYFARTVVEKFLSSGGNATAPSQTVELTGWEGREFAIKKIEIRARKVGSFTETYILENPPLEVVPDSTQKASKHKLTIRLRQVPEEERRTRTCQIHVYTDDPQTPEVVLRATVYFPRTIKSSSYAPPRTGTTSRFPIRPGTTKGSK